MVEPPEGNIADVQGICKYHRIPKANGNHEEARRKSATTEYLHRVRQVIHWYNKLAKGEDRSH